MFRPRRLLRSIIVANLALIIFAVVLGLAKTGNPSRYFGEGRFTTGISCAQLLGTAVFAFQLFRVRRRGLRQPMLRSPHSVWLLAAGGFVFLACDDAFQLHEQFDYQIRRAFHLPKTALTDHIDDALIGLYGIMGAAVFWICRREVLRFRHEMQRPLLAGFVSLLLTVICDAVANNRHVLFALTPDVATAKWLDGWLSMGDGAFTLLAEGFFLAAFALGWLAAVSPAASSLHGDGQALEVAP